MMPRSSFFFQIRARRSRSLCPFFGGVSKGGFSVWVAFLVSWGCLGGLGGFGGFVGEFWVGWGFFFVDEVF